MSIVESLPTYGVHYYAVKVQFYYSVFSFFHTHAPHTFLLTLALQMGSLGFGDRMELKANVLCLSVSASATVELFSLSMHSFS